MPSDKRKEIEQCEKYSEKFCRAKAFTGGKILSEDSKEIFGDAADGRSECESEKAEHGKIVDKKGKGRKGSNVHATKEQVQIAI